MGLELAALALTAFSTGASLKAAGDQKKNAQNTANAQKEQAKRNAQIEKTRMKREARIRTAAQVASQRDGVTSTASGSSIGISSSLEENFRNVDTRVASQSDQFDLQAANTATAATMSQVNSLAKLGKAGIDFTNGLDDGTVLNNDADILGNSVLAQPIYDDARFTGVEDIA